MTAAGWVLVQKLLLDETDLSLRPLLPGLLPIRRLHRVQRLLFELSAQLEEDGSLLDTRQFVLRAGTASAELALLSFPRVSAEQALDELAGLQRELEPAQVSCVAHDHLDQAFRQIGLLTRFFSAHGPVESDDPEVRKAAAHAARQLFLATEASGALDIGMMLLEEGRSCSA